MPEEFVVAFMPEAAADLNEIESYWQRRGEPERGARYFHDLGRAAEHELSQPDRARRGRYVDRSRHGGTREILVFGVYRIIYEIDEAARRVDVLRFWHAHRDDPAREA